MHVCISNFINHDIKINGESSGLVKMDYSFPHYFLSKQSVDDRALNQEVIKALKAQIPSTSIDIIEIGAGIGTMLKRLIGWGIITHANYLMVDENSENIDYAAAWIPEWAESSGLGVERSGARQLRIFDPSRDIQINFKRIDVFDFIKRNPPKSDLLIAHAVLDLFPMPDSLPKLFSLTRGLAWLTINFDGVTTFEPMIHPLLDEQIERLYHQTMDMRPTGGDSKSGRHLFSHFRSVNAQVLAAGASDWVVYPANGGYPADEAYFLNCILHFFEQSLMDCPQLDRDDFSRWLVERRKQIEQAELIYIAHQMDFLVKP